MIQSNADLYVTMEQLIATLLREGEVRLASQLRDALGISSLPGEILGETRLQLKEIRRTPYYGRVDIRSKVDEAVKYIDRVLGS
jgi:hypothetical protein